MSRVCAQLLQEMPSDNLVSHAMKVAAYCLRYWYFISTGHAWIVRGAVADTGVLFDVRR